MPPKVFSMADILSFTVVFSGTGLSLLIAGR